MPGTNSVLQDHSLHPRNNQLIQSTNAVGFADMGGSPPKIIVALNISDNTLLEASFSAMGCGYLIACGSACTELVKGRDLGFAERLDANEIEAFLGGLPVHRKYCAELAVSALKDAVSRRQS